MKRLAFLMVAGLTALSCTKKQEMETLYKENVHSKSVVDTTADYLYLPSVAEGDRNAQGGRPFWVGEQKMVRFRWLENELQVVQVEPDERFRDNPTNVKVVMSIPVSHVDYRCAKDKYGECTNKEEEVNDASFGAKGSFKPDFEKVGMREVNLMPIELDNLFQGGCYSETGTRLIGYNLSEEGLVLQLERSYMTNAECADISEMEDLFNLPFTERYTYSIVKLDKLKSKNYEPVLYPETDDGTFGFFTTTIRKLAADNRDMVEGEKVLLNRWNPKRKEVVYSLSPAFVKPENKIILDSTVEAISRMNQSLKKANAGIQIRLEMPSAGKVSGDLRNSEIVLIEDPLKVGLLGYGPSITDPFTGEIVYARVAMYVGVMKQFIWREYDRLVEESRAKSTSDGPVKLSPAAARKLGLNQVPQNLASHPAASEPQADLEAVKSLHSKLFGKTPEKGFFDPAKAAAIEKRLKQMKYMTDETAAQLVRYFKNPSDREFRKMGKEDLQTIKDRISELDSVTALALTGAYPAELFNFQAAVKKGVDDIIGKNPKPWLELSEEEQNEIVSKMMPIVWIPTLIHEVGHTLGLRHNFAGSEDPANFYSADELGQMGIDHQVPYSSMMEYPYSDLSALPVMGLYDIAALRFGYAREVETADNRIVNVPRTLADLERQGTSLKAYKYCTDEMVDANPNCNRFDEGTTLPEMMTQMIEAAEETSKRSNRRMGRRSFSSYNDSGAASRVDYTFYNLRLVFERYALLKREYDIDDATWEKVPFLKEINDSVKIGAEHLLSTVIKADTVCAVAAKADPTTIVGFVSLAETPFGRRGLDCFDDVALSDAYEVVGQAGESFINRKASTNPNAYVDQIDLRGTYASKLLAIDALLDRRLGSSLFDDPETFNYLDHHEVGPVLEGLLVDVLLDRVSSPVEFKIPSTGQVIAGQFATSWEKTHVIPQPLDPRLRRWLGLSGNTPFPLALVKRLGKIVDSSRLTSTMEQFEAFGVRTTLPNDGTTLPQTENIRIGGTTYIALPENKVALVAIRDLKIQRVLSPLTEEQLEKVYALATATAPDTSGLTPTEKAAFDLGAETILRFAQGGMATQSYLSDLLAYLPKL